MSQFEDDLEYDFYFESDGYLAQDYLLLRGDLLWNKKILVKEMSDEYINNCIKLLEKKDYVSIWTNIFKKELNLREAIRTIK